MPSLDELQAKKAAVSKRKDAAVAKAKAEADELNEQISVATATAALEKALEGMTDEERQAALEAVSK